MAMHVTIAGKQVETSEALRTHVRDGLDLVAGKYFDHALGAHVTFGRDRSFFVCDINIHAGRGLSMRGEGQGSDAHKAFDQAATHIGKRLRRYRRRVNEHARGDALDRGADVVAEPSLEAAAASTPAAEPMPTTTTVKDGAATIVCERLQELALLSLEEAVSKLDDQPQGVVLFRNPRSGTLSAVYRRPDGHFGWVDQQHS